MSNVVVCEHGQIRSESETQVGSRLVIQKHVTSSCMYHAICGLVKILNEAELKGRCPAEKNNPFGYCDKRVVYEQ